MYAIIVDPFSSGADFLKELMKYDIKVITVVSAQARKAVFFSQLTNCISEDCSLEDLIERILNITLGENILFCLAGSEVGVQLSEKISQELNIKTNLKEFSKERINKYLMHERIREFGLKSIEQFLIKDIKNKIPNFKFPVVLKPTQSAGSDAVVFCKNENEVKRYIECNLGTTNKIGIENNELLLQEFITGTEFVVDLTTYDDYTELVAMWKYEKKLTINGNFIYSSLKLVDSQNIYFDRLLNYSKQVVKALGTCIGPSHVEIMIDNVDEPVLIEVGSRPHGGKSQVIMKECLGYNQITRTLELIIEQKKNITYEPKKYGELVFLISSKKGVFKGFGLIEKMKELDGYIDFFPFLKVNDDLSITIDLLSIPGIIMFASERKDLVRESVKKLRSLESRDDFYIIEE
ncbi:ATP-grasp domain-containing protein [Fluviispira multicolorata]|uniref:ATP-grasp domain-containing protein n=1 Tax=Fluviispira multicolorata TaxID=2654512 RepID=A0A833JAA2_9BACT|nr:ATP-grasp domain-containing protein [Fluviispira multicolorata]KAB8027716.1 ATP-grasp domain-containing protein [Fluviispira multicolorata]